jgi:hypothetical protein
MKISELIEELEALKAKHGDVPVVAWDEEGRYEINKASLVDYITYNEDGGSFKTQLAISLH